MVFKITRKNSGAILLGDIITKINGQKTNSIDSILTILEQHKPNDILTLFIRRAQTKQSPTIKLKLGEFE